MVLEREEETPDPDEYIRKPPPGYGEDKTVLCLERKLNASFIGPVKEGEPIPPGAEIIQGSPTTIEMARDFLHPATQTIVDEDALWRLAYAIDINRFAYATYKICREGAT